MTLNESNLPAPIVPKIILGLIIVASAIVVIADLVNDGKGYEPRGKVSFDVVE